MRTSDKEQADLRAKGLSKCGICHEIKPLSEFYTSKKPTGVMRVDPDCKPCARAKQNKALKEKRAAKKKANKEWDERYGDLW